MSNPEIPQPQQGQEGLQTPHSRIESVMKTPMSRRKFLGGVLGAAGTALLSERVSAAPQPEVQDSFFGQRTALSLGAENTKLQDEVAFAQNEDPEQLSTPTVEGIRDERVEYFPPTELITAPELLTSPPVHPIESIDINTRVDADRMYGQNKLDLFKGNAYTRTHLVWENYVNGENYSGVKNLNQSGQFPPEPNWTEYRDRVDSGEEMSFYIMALSMDDPVDPALVTWRKVNMRQQMRFKFTSEKGLIELMGKGPGLDQRLGCTYRVDDNGLLQTDVLMDPEGLPDGVFPTREDLYNAGYGIGILRSMQALSTTLGIIELNPDNQQYGNLYQGYQENYLRQVEKPENPSNSYFPDQTDLVFSGEEIVANGQVIGWTNPTLQVHLAQ